MLRNAALWLAAVCPGLAQQPPVFRVPVRIVQVPAIVTDSAGHMVRDLDDSDFALFDNDRPQVARMGYTGEKIALAVAVQTNHAVQAWLPHVRRIGNLVEASLAGASGDISLLSFNDDVTAVPRFADLKAMGDQSHCLDAVMAAAAILRQASPGRRRVLLLVAQSGDYGSAAGLRDVIRELEWNNIAVYTMAMPRVGKDLLGRIRVSGAPQEGGGIVVRADLLKLVPEIYRGAKSTAGEDAVTLMTDYLGGKRIPFRNLRGLEAGLSEIAAELHTGYVLTFTPSLPGEGFHRIRVETPGRHLTVRARPGYYVPRVETQP